MNPAVKNHLPSENSPALPNQSVAPRQDDPANLNGPVRRGRAVVRTMTLRSEPSADSVAQYDCGLDLGRQAGAERDRESQELFEATRRSLAAKFRQLEERLHKVRAADAKLRDSLASGIKELDAQFKTEASLLQSGSNNVEHLHETVATSVRQAENLDSSIQQLQSLARAGIHRAHECELRVAKLESTHREKEEAWQAKTRELREQYDARLRELELALESKTRSLHDRESELSQTLQLVSQYEETAKRSERLSAELQKVTAELTEKKVELAAFERDHWRAIGRGSFWSRTLKRNSIRPTDRSPRSSSPEVSDQGKASAPTENETTRRG